MLRTLKGVSSNGIEQRTMVTVAQNAKATFTRMREDLPRRLEGYFFLMYEGSLGNEDHLTVDRVSHETQDGLDWQTAGEAQADEVLLD